MPAISRRVIVFAGMFLLLAVSAPSYACLNDRDTDTLAEENRALPGMVEVITGRFERNPPLYYRMRISRIEKELAHNPDALALYDDIAVAYDRLGESTKALEWMAKKREILPLFLPGSLPPEWREPWYRYYANTGTFRVHRWLRDGADRKRIAEVKQARAEIAKAIAIKPDAHFGRETYQLQVMDWILSKGYVKDDLETKSFKDNLHYRTDLARFIKAKDGQPVTDGLAGLIVLGNAWESVDVLNALAYASYRKGNGKIAYLAKLRTYELEKTGRFSLVPESYVPKHKLADSDSPYRIAGAERVRAKYAELRAEAEGWQKARTKFMMARLSSGRHPDTDSTFWNGYHPRPAPSLSTGTFAEWQDKTFTMTNIFLAVFYGLVGLPTFVIARAFVRWWRNRV